MKEEQHPSQDNQQRADAVVKALREGRVDAVVQEGGISLLRLHHVEQALKQSEERFRVLVESWAQAIWEADAEGMVQEGSPSWREYTGQPLAEQMQSGWLNVVHPDDREAVRQLWQEAVAHGSKVNAEFQLRGPHGNWRWTNLRAAPIHHGDESVAKWVAMNIDINARKEAEADLKKARDELEQRVEQRTVELVNSKVRYRQLVETINDVVYTCDSDGCLTYIGPQVSRYGFRVEEVIGRHILDFIAPRDRERVAAELRHTLETGEGAPTIFRLLSPRGDDVWVEESGDANRNSSGEIIGLSGVLRDVTDRIRHEQTITRQRDNLRMLAARLANAHEEERQRIAEGLHDEAGQLIAACQLALVEAEEGEAAEQSEALHKANDLLNKASDEIRGLTFELRASMAFEAGFGTAVEELCRHMSERFNIDFVVRRVDDHLVVPRELRSMLYHSLRELLLNAAKHAKSDHVEVSLEMVPLENEPQAAADQALRLEVRDYGQGFDTGVLDQPLTRKGGFGLTHLRERITDLGGHFSMEPALPRGTIVTVLIPLERRQ